MPRLYFEPVKKKSFVIRKNHLGGSWSIVQCMNYTKKQMSNSKESESVRIFDGTNPSDYWQWRRWIMCKCLADLADKEASWGPKILSMLRGEAEMACEDIDLSDLAKKGGHTAILDNVLDLRYPKKEKRDQLAEALLEMFMLCWDPKVDASSAAYTGRASTIFARGKERGVEMPDAAKAFLVSLGCRLSVEQRTVILAIAGNKYEFTAVCEAIRSAYPKGIPSSHRHNTNMVRLSPCEAFMMESMSECSTRCPSEIGDGDDSVGSLVDDTQDDAVVCLLAGTSNEILSTIYELEQEDGEELEEEEVIEALASWKQTRDSVATAKKVRGFGGQNPRQPNVPKIAKKVKCFTCGKLGHFSRDCRQNKNRNNKPGPRKGTPVRFVSNVSNLYMVNEDKEHNGSSDDEQPQGNRALLKWF